MGIVKRVLATVFIIAVWSVGFYSGVHKQYSQAIPVQQSPSPKQNPMGNQVLIKTSVGEFFVLIMSDKIYINVYGTGDGEKFKQFEIQKTSYPKLFQQGVANFSFITVETMPDNIHVRIANNQPDHGAFSATYQLVIDPITGEINDNQANLNPDW